MQIVMILCPSALFFSKILVHPEYSIPDVKTLFLISLSPFVFSIFQIYTALIDQTVPSVFFE